MSTGAARLEVVAGKAVGMSILIEDELLIGRHAEGAGRLADDEEISRSHARVTLDASGFCAIEDLGSTNGTFMNGLRISVPQTLAVGDTIELGGTTLAVRELPRSGATVIGGVELPRASARPAAGVAPPPARDLEDVAPPPAPTLAPRPLAEPPRVEPPPSPTSPPPAEAPGPLAAAPDESPPLTIGLEIDWRARRARVVLDGASEPVSLELDEEVWRPTRPA
jgi:predicted component of type VI protein secretion system